MRSKLAKIKVRPGFVSLLLPSRAMANRVLAVYRIPAAHATHMTASGSMQMLERVDYAAK